MNWQNCFEKKGFDVTQATVSRDIRKLALSKVPGKNGRQKYALLNHQDHQMAESTWES